MGLISGIVMGLFFGIGLMAGWARMMRYRSAKRIAKAADIKLLASLNRDDLKKICGDNLPEWISFPVYEQVKWLNKTLTKLWPFVAEAATMVIRESVEPLLEEYRPPGITSLKFSKLSLGNVAPKIEGIRVQSLTKGQIIMDIDFRWGGDPSIILAVEAALVASIPIQDLFVAGIDTTSSSIEWVMTELLRNPEKLEKVREELQQVLTKGEQLEESQMSELPYLQAVVKETFRLHPAIPMLVPHKSEVDVELCDFMVPKGAQILVNVWAMGRDSSIWTNPNQFTPERFVKSDIDFKGQDFELIPFGAGRRICPGLPLASRTMHVVLATLLFNYDWKLTDGQKPEDMDISDKYGITLHKAQPLLVIPIPA